MKCRTVTLVLSALLLCGCAGRGEQLQTGDTTQITTETVSTAISETEVKSEETTALPETETETEEAIDTEPIVLTEAYYEEETAAPPEAENVSERVTVEDGVVYDGGFYYVDGILLVNKTYPLPDWYAPGSLTDETLSAFYRMQSAAASDGITLFVKSGYRSYVDQRIIYAGYAASDGAAAADRYSARAGHSEHQSGMALDLNSLDYDFAYTPEGIWLQEHCAEYGFIIRYPAGKEEYTGYVYEPWHVRYVGEEAARKITDSGLCLEEYYGISSAYR